MLNSRDKIDLKEKSTIQLTKADELENVLSFQIVSSTRSGKTFKVNLVYTEDGMEKTMNRELGEEYMKLLCQKAQVNNILDKEEAEVTSINF